jgi:TIR domain
VPVASGKASAPMSGGTSREIDFFVSYTGVDRAWAEWIAWVLEAAGYTVRVQGWDFRAGSHFVYEMHRANESATRTIAVLSAAYLESAFTQAEWQAAWASDPDGGRRKLLVVRIEDCYRPGLLGQIVSVDLFGVSRDEAREALLAAVAGQRRKPTREPKWPSGPGLSVPPPPSRDRSRIFLCHSSSDKDAVRDLYRRLRQEGLWPWLDEEDILPGQNWDAEIRRAISTSRQVLVCLSRSSVNKRGYVQKEIKQALDVADEQPEDSIFLIPVRFEPCEVPPRLRTWQWVDLFAANGYQRLLLSLGPTAS